MLRALRQRANRSAVRAVRWTARNRHRLPRPALAAVEWLRWHLPTGLVWRLTGRRGKPVDLRAIQPTQELPEPPTTGTRLFVGPVNYAGQGHLWLRAATANLPDVSGVSYALHVEGGFDFPADYIVTPVVYRKNSVWQRQIDAYVADNFTHVMIEAVKPLFADLHRIDPFREARSLAERGVAVAMMAHGTDVRLPSRHGAKYPWSPFLDRDWDVVDQLEANAAKNLFNLNRFRGPVFVSTPDLLDDLPDATWCPVVVEPGRWVSTSPVLERDVPVVAHVPSNARVKGTEQVEEAVRALEEEGLISYLRIQGVPSAQMPAVYTQADVVLDQFRLGSYGVAACEAMAAGRVVVGNVTDEIRGRVLDLAGHELPIVQALPEDIGAVLRRVVTDREEARRQAATGPEFVREVHDGRLSAQQLKGFLGSSEAVA